MSAFDGELIRIQAKWANPYMGIRERFEPGTGHVQNIVSGFKGAGAIAVKVERLSFVEELIPDISFGDPEVLAEDW